MHVWLVTVGEPLPIGEGARQRLQRTGHLARILAGRGHTVVWWTSTFDHYRRQHYAAHDDCVRVGEGLTLRLLHGGGYGRNVSLARLRDHRRVATKFAHQARQAGEAPDVVVCSLPTLELASESVLYGRARGVPVVLDMRDMWPDIFVDTAPAALRPLARLALRPLFRQARAACAGATAITGITPAFVAWGLARGRRAASPLDRDFPMGHVTQAPPGERLRAAEQFWDERGVTAGGPPVACFIGTLGRQFDLHTVVDAARALEAGGSPWRFVVCGAGDRLEDFRARAAGLANVLFTGWVDAAAIHVLLQRSSAGLDPLPDRYDFLATINNKAIDYLGAGVPVISSPPRGVLCDLLRQERCGDSHEYGDAAGLVRILVRWAAQPTERAVCARNARSLFERRFTVERAYGDMAVYLEELVAAEVARTTAVRK